MFDSRGSMMMIVAICSFLVVAMAASITFAYFYSSRTVLTTMYFHGGTVLSITGTDYQTDNTNTGVSIANNATTGTWQSSTNNGAWTTSNSTQVVESLRLSGLLIKAQQNAGTYVRVFVAVKINAVSTATLDDGSLTIPTLTFSVDGGATATTVANGNYTTKEQAFVSANTNASSTLYTTCAIVTMPTGNDWVKLFDHYTVFALDRNNVQDSNYQHAQISAMIMLSSSTSNNAAAWVEAQTDATYSFSY